MMFSGQAVRYRRPLVGEMLLRCAVVYLAEYQSRWHPNPTQRNPVVEYRGENSLRISNLIHRISVIPVFATDDLDFREAFRLRR